MHRRQLSEAGRNRSASDTPVLYGYTMIDPTAVHDAFHSSVDRRRKQVAAKLLGQYVRAGALSFIFTLESNLGKFLVKELMARYTRVFLLRRVRL